MVYEHFEWKFWIGSEGDLEGHLSTGHFFSFSGLPVADSESKSSVYVSYTCKM